jgi:hypothetical protein
MAIPDDIHKNGSGPVRHFSTVFLDPYHATARHPEGTGTGRERMTDDLSPSRRP